MWMVCKKFPARAGEQPLSMISRNELRMMVASNTSKESARDVTGAMVGNSGLFFRSKLRSNYFQWATSKCTGERIA